MEGKVGSRAETLNGFKSAGGEDVVCARVHDIFPPQGNSGVTSGVVFIESGEFIDQKAVFDRKDCWLSITVDVCSLKTFVLALQIQHYSITN